MYSDKIQIISAYSSVFLFALEILDLKLHQLSWPKLFVLDRKIGIPKLFSKLIYRVNLNAASDCLMCVHYHLNLKMPRKPASESVVCLCCLLHLLGNVSNILFAYRQTVWTQIRLLLDFWSTLFATMIFKVTDR